jgi:acylpyruvate hydrolase
MRLVTYQHEGQVRTGALLGEFVVDLNRAYRAALQHLGNVNELAVADLRLPIDMVSLLNGGEASLSAAGRAVTFVQERQAAGDPTLDKQGILYATGRVTLLAPVLRPGKVVCLGLNYREHAAETGMPTPEYPVLFHKVAGSLIGQGQPIVIPRISDQVDYEAELAVIIGRRGKYIAEEDALTFVAGYTIANDVSARDLQMRTSQWTSGKMLDSFAPLGPALVTRDEIPDPNALRLKTTLNGTVVQDSTTADMIFRVPFIISYLSQIATLEPGDVIMTGTPSGVGMSRNPRIFMKAGDSVSIEIEHLGVLTNPVVAEK